MNHTRTFVLGTAQWGWTVDRPTAFALLDGWLNAGHRHLDAATNYPINRQPADFRASERILIEYVQAHGLQHQLAITMKIGSMDNMRTPDINLNPSFLLMMADEYRRTLGSALYGLMIHWDNRQQAADIAPTLDALRTLQQQGLSIGFSGIAHPEVYAPLLQERQLFGPVELKHHPFHSDLPRYQSFFDEKFRFWAYGINAGGLKLHDSPADTGTFMLRGGQSFAFAEPLAAVRAKLAHWNTVAVRPPITTMNQLGMLNAWYHPRISGLIVGPRDTAQLRQTFTFADNLAMFDYADIYKDLIALNRLKTGSQSLS
jgi:aryl-alcohol dehydrogenase-like predicted oxidoreductase